MMPYKQNKLLKWVKTTTAKRTQITVHKTNAPIRYCFVIEFPYKSDSTII